MCVFAGCTAWGASLFADRPDKSHVSFLQVQAGEIRRPGLLAGQRAGALQRVRAVVVGAQGKLGKLLQKQRLIPAKEDVAVFHVRL